MKRLVPFLLLFVFASCTKELNAPQSVQVDTKIDPVKFTFAARTDQTHMIDVRIKVFLMGAYDSTAGQMHRKLHESHIALPTNQPFSGAPYFYPGSETAMSSVITTVDWILIELQDPTGAIVGRQAAFVTQNGEVTDYTGDYTVHIPVNSNYDNYYVVVRHLSHLGVKSAVTRSTFGFRYGIEQDFTFSGLSSLNGSSVALDQRTFGMQGGNANSNKNVKANGPGNDRDLIRANQGLEQGHLHSDINMDGITNQADLDFLQNRCLGGSTALSTIITEKI